MNAPGPHAHAAVPSRRTMVAVVVAGAIALTLAITVTLHPDPLPGEVALVTKWQSLGEPVPTLAEWVRLVTSSEANLMLMLVPAWFLIRRDTRSGWTAVAIALFTMYLAQPVLKEIIDRPRPTEEQVEVRAEYTSKSFPSGHSMSTTAVWGAAVIVAAGLRRPRIAAVCCVPIAVTGVASQVQGVHWPTDATGGTLLGGLAAVAIGTVLLRADQARSSSSPVQST